MVTRFLVLLNYGLLLTVYSVWAYTGAIIPGWLAFAVCCIAVLSNLVIRREKVMEQRAREVEEALGSRGIKSDDAVHGNKW